jgi:hypothetical protein
MLILGEGGRPEIPKWQSGQTAVPLFGPHELFFQICSNFLDFGFAASINHQS